MEGLGEKLGAGNRFEQGISVLGICLRRLWDDFLIRGAFTDTMFLMYLDIRFYDAKTE